MMDQIYRVLSSLCSEVGTPRALAVKLLAEAGEWTQLQGLRVRPSDYEDGESYWKDALVTELLRKCDLPTDVDKKAAAVETFWACEARNARTNRSLVRFLPETLFIEDIVDESVYQFITEWRKEIRSVLGHLPDHLTPRFSSGATYADTGLLTTTPDKMSSRPTIYSATRCILPMWSDTSWARILCEDRPWQSEPRTVRGNIFFCVPKDGTKFRGCCKEASISVSYQLDVGRHMKTRLRRIGIDLKEGQLLHRELARAASVHGHLATIDMSNASDTLCRNLVKLLLPWQWYELLNSLRASHTRLDGQWVRLEKFSSMGNGFTFELETLIFATLARVLVRLEGGDPDLVKCYGDDLIVPSSNYKSVVAALERFGFEPNMNKTFAEGPFRESCGGDFWHGVPVRAHYLKELPDEPQHWISLANGLRRVAYANDNSSPRWDIVRRAWLRALDPIPSDVRRCRGPEALGDVVIHDKPELWAYAKPPYQIEGCLFGQPDSWETVWIQAYVPVPNVLPWNHWLPSVQLASCTLGLRSEGVSPRGALSYRRDRVPYGPGISWVPS